MLAQSKKQDNNTKIFKRVLDYIEENLTSDLSLEKLGEISFISKYHFHRKFKDHFGESLSDYIKKRRLSKAAILLVETKHSIEEIGLETGYSSIEAFNRAFKKRFKFPPAEFRKNGIAASNQLTTAINPERYRNQFPEFTEVYFPETKLVGSSGTGYETATINVNNPDGLGKHDQFLHTIYEYKYPIKDALFYGVHITTSLKEDPIEKFIREWKHFTGVLFSPDADIGGAEYLTIPASKCLYVCFKGTHSEFTSYVDWLYEKHIPKLRIKTKNYTFEYSAMGLNSELLNPKGFLDYDKFITYIRKTPYTKMDYYSPEFLTHFFIPYE